MERRSDMRIIILVFLAPVDARKDMARMMKASCPTSRSYILVTTAGGQRQAYSCDIGCGSDVDEDRLYLLHAVTLTACEGNSQKWRRKDNSWLIFPSPF